MSPPIVALYNKDVRVWIPNPTTVWEGAVVSQLYTDGDKVMHIVTDSGESRNINITKSTELPPLRNPKILIGQNDLTELSYLHEPDVLYNLQVRFCERQAIYTYCGIVLIAINPYAELPLYGADIIRAYRGHSMGELEPHIFAVAEEAYAKLERENCDLSIVVSGESGAGKTVSAKYAMRYFAAVGGNESETQIERKVLASSPIMEAIGNAKTTRNDNSSRFGKFTKLLFTNRLGMMSLTGATMQTYLLEKSRVVFQAPDERNYHIFYQLCAARDKYPELMLEHQSKYRYLNQGNSPDIPRVSDLSEFQETINALKILGFEPDDIDNILKVLASLLHLGNIRFADKINEDGVVDSEASTIAENDLHLNVLCDILHIEKSELKKWLCTRQIESINENVLIPIDREKAEAGRDALAKHIYSKVFQHIVEIVNKSLDVGKKQNCFIGVLDIYGFETFEINSFEQFCINYANEKLQLQFNQHVFKLEQEVYLREGIEWTMIDFYDNQPCIDLIESKLGILDLLDEECRMPKGSDQSWVGKLVEKCKKFNHFEKTRFGNSSFLIHHFSDNVIYQATGFLEKNRDTVSKELVNVFRESNMTLCQNLMNLDESLARDSKTSSSVKVVISAAKMQVTPGKQNKHTVGSKFRESLNLLITTLHATTPHYVRCIKPNEEKQAFEWDSPKIVQQLRACGILETVRISAAGFPSRWTYDDFYERYRLLCKRNQIVDWNVKATCVNILKNSLSSEDDYRVGKTLLFFRAGKVAYLEQLRTDIRKASIIKVQSVVRRFICRRQYAKIKVAALGIQRFGRGMLARRKAQSIRENRAAITIQKHVRGWLCRSRYEKLRRSICAIQVYARGMLARQRHKVVLDNFKAIQIQRYCRGYLSRKNYSKRLRRIILCQASIRAFLARRLYKRLKAEARTITHIQNKYTGLEKKVMLQQGKIDELTKENNVLRIKADEAADLKETMKRMEAELKEYRAKSILKDKELEALRCDLEKERDEKMALVVELDKEKQQKDELKANMIVENEELHRQVNEMTELANKTNTVVRNRLLSELDTNEIAQAYQKVVKDKEILEKENYLLRHEVDRMDNFGSVKHNQYITHSRSVSNVSSINDEDFGYSSTKNTLESRQKEILINESPEASEKLNSNITSTPKVKENNQQPIALVLRLRKLLEDEKTRNKLLHGQLERVKTKTNTALNTEDSLKMNELEVENEKIRQDYQLLRNSIERGVEHQELEAQYNSMQEELKRRRDECIQLRSVLAQQSQSLRTLGSTSVKLERGSDKTYESGELIEAFQAQKLVNRQLESELTALTEENNAKIVEYNTQIDELRVERDRLQTILHTKIDSSLDELSLQEVVEREEYLKYELEKVTTSNTTLMETYNKAVKDLKELTKRNAILKNRLKDHGIVDSIIMAASDDVSQNLAVVIKKEKTYQGIFKFHQEECPKILQRLVNDLEPRTAIGLLPGLPAYILFMCVRYTDLINNESYVTALLGQFVITQRKFFQVPKPTEYRVLWLVNNLILNNLMRQYGGLDEYMGFNTATQNQQQLNNFNLVEYRTLIYELITKWYTTLVIQVQECIKSYIVPAILDHDEMSRGNANRRTMSLDMSPDQKHPTEPKSLINHLEQFYKQFEHFGLDKIYIEQIFEQLFYYIYAVSMNSLMLRPEMFMWKTGMKLRYNIGCLETWAAGKKMPNDLVEPITPLIQVSSLLQSRKSEQDVDTIFDLCTLLSTAQVMKIIKSYKLDDCEEAIEPKFIDNLFKKLSDRPIKINNDEFMVNEKIIFPLNVVFKYSDIKLEMIDLPPILNLDKSLTKI